MHSNHYGNGVVVHHNGDYSGDVKIIVSTGASETFTMANGEPAIEITVPFEDMRALVFDYLRMKAISNLEQMTDDDFEEYLEIGWQPAKEPEPVLEPGHQMVIPWVNSPR